MSSHIPPTGESRPSGPTFIRLHFTVSSDSEQSRNEQQSEPNANASAPTPGDALAIAFLSQLLASPFPVPLAMRNHTAPASTPSSNASATASQASQPTAAAAQHADQEQPQNGAEQQQSQDTRPMTSSAAWYYLIPAAAPEAALLITPTFLGVPPSAAISSMVAAFSASQSANGQRNAQPPASAHALVAQVHPIVITESRKRKRNLDSCSICLDAFEDGVTASELPCHHIYHSECISRWLKESNMCPHCRYELLTDNEDYNVGVRRRMDEREKAKRHQPDTTIDDDENEDTIGDKLDDAYEKRPKQSESAVDQADASIAPAAESEPVANRASESTQNDNCSLM